jgi:CheY-specific phosphatase CheX
MQTKAMVEALSRAAITVLEETAFAMPMVAPARPWRGELVQAELLFKGPLSGTIILATAPTTAGRLAANILGVEKVERDQISDAVGELLNILAGCVMEEWFGVAQTVSLGIPSTRMVQTTDHDTLVARATLSLSLITEEDERVDVAAVIDA